MTYLSGKTDKPEFAIKVSTQKWEDLRPFFDSF